MGTMPMEMQALKSMTAQFFPPSLISIHSLYINYACKILGTLNPLTPC